MYIKMRRQQPFSNIACPARCDALRCAAECGDRGRSTGFGIGVSLNTIAAQLPIIKPVTVNPLLFACFSALYPIKPKLGSVQAILGVGITFMTIDGPIEIISVKDRGLCDPH